MKSIDNTFDKSFVGKISRLYAGKDAQGQRIEKKQLLLDLEGAWSCSTKKDGLFIFLPEIADPLQYPAFSNGLCVNRFLANAYFEPAAKSMSSHPGDRWRVGGVTFEIMKTGKRCHDACPLCQTGIHCPLSSQILFAKILREGMVQLGDTIHHL